jgi:hypothetical protein
MPPKGTLWPAVAFDRRSDRERGWGNGLARACKHLVVGGRDDDGVVDRSALWN